MKKTVEIIGLPIINIADGFECGDVKSLVINPEKGAIEFLTIENEEWQTSVKAVPFKKIIGIGEYAVTVESENAIIDLSEIPVANQLVNRKVKIISTRVMTRKGELLGVVKEFFVNDDNGQIVGLVLDVKGEEKQLDAEAVVTFGKDIIIVTENINDFFYNRETLLVDEVAASVEMSPEEFAVDKKKKSVIKEEKIDLLVGKTVTMSAFGSDEITSHIQGNPLDILREKQMEILIGKTVTKDIFSKNGGVLLEKGSVLTRTDVLAAQNEGPGVIIELSMNLES